VVESSLDGENWTEIDRKTDNTDLAASPYAASFAIAGSPEGRFIRLTQTGLNYYKNDALVIYSIEFFGTLLE
jgi:hypothetical protein